MTARFSAVLLFAAAPLFAQQPPPPTDEPPHGIEMVDPAPLGGAIAPPLSDFISMDANVRERISFFEGGLVAIDVSGSGATIRKRVILPDDAFKSYTTTISAAHL